MSPSVALVRGRERRETILRSLELISEDIQPGKRIVIKPNFVSTRKPLAVTHVDAVRAVLDFLRDRKRGEIVVAEGASFSDTMDGFKNFGYHPLHDEYGIDLIDLNRDEWIEVDAFDKRLQPIKLRLARTLVDSDYIISVSPPKTHDTVVVTLSLKNIIMGGLIRDQEAGSLKGLGMLASLGIGSILPASIRDWPPLHTVRDWINKSTIKSDKLAMHQGYPAINLNLYRLARVVKPHLSIIDGTIGMEGNGPIMGTGVNLGVVIASTDFLAADSLAAYIMGFRLEEIGYLHYCSLDGMGVGDLTEMDIRGDDVEDCVLPFKPHQTYKAQLKWRDESLKDLVPQASIP
jgi:uncharacterized protein (DUF362 family)